MKMSPVVYSTSSYSNPKGDVTKHFLLISEREKEKQRSIGYLSHMPGLGIEPKTWMYALT